MADKNNFALRLVAGWAVFAEAKQNNNRAKKKGTVCRHNIRFASVIFVKKYYYISIMA